MRNPLRFLITLCLSGILFACLEEPKYSIVPAISFNKIRFIDATSDTILVSINVKDGDGDLGLSADDERQLFNYFMDLYIKDSKGDFVKYEFSDPSLTLNGRFPILKEGADKAISAEVNWRKAITPGFKRVISNQTIKFRLSVLDRKQHQSNFIFSNSLIVPQL